MLNGQSPSGNGHPQSPEAIRNRMESLRDGISQEAIRVRRTAQEAVDWRTYVKRYPIATAGLALAVGYMLVPTKSKVVRPTDDQMREITKKAQIHVYAPKNMAGKPQTSFSHRALALLGTAGARAAMAYFGKRAGEIADGVTNPSSGTSNE